MPEGSTGDWPRPLGSSRGGEIDEHAGESLHWQVFVLDDR